MTVLHWRRTVDARLANIEDLLGQIMPLERRIMTALSDLQAADTALQQEVATFLADIAARLSNSPDPAAVEAVVSDINAQVSALQAGDPGAQPANVTPPPPAPAGT